MGYYIFYNSKPVAWQLFGIVFIHLQNDGLYGVSTKK